MQVAVRVHGALSDFLDPARRGLEFRVELGPARSVKDLVESLGVPHCEVLVVLVDGRGVGYERMIVGGERIAVHPHFCDLDLAGIETAGAPLPADPRFALDGHLGRLAAYLRALGIDTAHDRDADDASIARRAHDEDRVVLTRDIGLLKRSIVRHGYFVRETSPRAQLAEVVRRFRLSGRTTAFTRCPKCNALLVPATRDEVGHAVPAAILARFDQFSRCQDCARVFWRGTHHERLSQILSPHLGPAPGADHS